MLAVGVVALADARRLRRGRYPYDNWVMVVTPFSRSLRCSFLPRVPMMLRLSVAIAMSRQRLLKLQMLQCLVNINETSTSDAILR